MANGKAVNGGAAVAAPGSGGPHAPDLNIRLICRDCRRDPPNLVECFAEGDLVCGDCGLVLGDRIVDTRSEWRTFSNEDEDPSRVGGSANPLLNGTQLDTIISKLDGGSGASRNLSKTHGRASAVKGERHLVQTYKEISAMCDAIGLPRLIGDAAKHLYKQVDERKLLRGKSNDALIAACIFIACRQEGVTRTFKEICALTKVPKKEIGRCFKALARELDTAMLSQDMAGGDLMLRFCSYLSLPAEVKKAAMAVGERAKDLGTLAGKSPVSIAAACIYMVAGLYGVPRLAKEIAVVAGVSEVTIKNAYKGLHAAREELIKHTDAAHAIDSLPSP
ncbi:transcription initiation factor IIB [Syncephalis fuscata]|nr:transcription initiation factor IIB [Syncephalis fuscata]